MPIHRIALFIFVLLSAGLAQGRTQLSVSVGWDDNVRQSRWSPIFVRLSDDQPRNVILTVEAGHDAIHRMRVTQGFAIGPADTTFPVFLPLNGYVYSWDMRIKVVDAGTGRELAAWTSQDSELRNQPAMDANLLLIGVTGSSQAVSLSKQIWQTDAKCIYIDPRTLPFSGMLLDSFDAILLLQPDLEAISRDQQQALLDWARAGGRLILCPADGSLPGSSPLLPFLPAQVGPATTIPLSDRHRQDFALPSTLKNFPARQLTPAADARPIEILGNQPAYSRALGLGEVVVLPINLAQFTHSQGVGRIFKKLIPSLDKPANPNNAARFGYYSQDDSLRTQAIESIGDQIAGIEGIGEFGFSYVAVTLIGLILVVGPIDWFILKKLGRQPFTWVTTTFWIVVVTLGALYIGHVFKSGELHLRTVRLIDQVDNVGVAESTVLSLYSPITTDYWISGPDDAWWEPAASQQGYYGPTGKGSTAIDFRQTQAGNLPVTMEVPVWNLRLLRSDAIRISPPLVKAELRYTPMRNSITGTIQNLSGKELKDIRIRLKTAESIETISMAAGESREVAFSTRAISRADSVKEENLLQPLPDYMPGSVVGATWFPQGALSPQRMRRVSEILKEDEHAAVLVAEIVNPDPIHKLEEKQPIEKHWAYLRALIHFSK